MSVPASERRTRYTPSVSTTEFSVGFTLYDDGDDQYPASGDIDVYLDGVAQVGNWTLTATFFRGEATDGLVTFSSGVTGTVDIVGDRNVRRTTDAQFDIGLPVSPAGFNLWFNLVTAQLLELYWKAARYSVDYYNDALDFDGNTLRNIGEGSAAGDALRKDQTEEFLANVNAGGLAYSALLVTYSDGISGWGGTVQAALDAAYADVSANTAAAADHETRIATLEGASASAALIPIGGEIDWPGPTAPAGWLFEYGQAISRTTYSDLLDALTRQVTGDVTSGNTTIANVSANITAQGLVGAAIEGTGIEDGTTIASVGATSIVLSQAPTASNNGVALRIFPHGNGDESTTFNIPDARGRVAVGRDTMGGSAASRMTGSATGGLNAANLSGTGGEQSHAQTVAELAAHQHYINYNGAHGSASSSRPNDPRWSWGDTSHTNTTNNAITNSSGSGNAANVVQPGRVVNRIIFTGVT